MKKKSVLLFLLKLFGLSFVGWLFWLFIFAIFTPEEAQEVSEVLSKLGLVLGLCTGLLISSGLNYNQATKKRQKIKAAKSNILIVEEREDSLLDKANKVVERYLAHEKEILINKEEPTTFTVTGALQFQNFIENHPQTKANAHISELLNQIKDCENTLANFKIRYNSDVESYNSLINSIPLSVLKGVFHFEEIAYYERDIESVTLTDEMLDF